AGVRRALGAHRGAGQLCPRHRGRGVRRPPHAGARRRHPRLAPLQETDRRRRDVRAVRRRRPPRRRRLPPRGPDRGRARAHPRRARRRAGLAMQDGILVIDKPRGMTSADVVARVKRALRARRCGHTGTLDPMATGVLPIALDEGTKAAAFLLRDDKTYEGELELGVTTDTLDAEGAVTGRADPGDVSAETLRAAFAAWVGDREQIPPMYSALKHGGKRLYELARAGVEVDRPARRIRIDRLELQWFRPPHAR